MWLASISSLNSIKLRLNLNFPTYLLLSHPTHPIYSQNPQSFPHVILLLHCRNNSLLLAVIIFYCLDHYKFLRSDLPILPLVSLQFVVHNTTRVRLTKFKYIPHHQTHKLPLMASALI